MWRIRRTSEPEVKIMKTHVDAARARSTQSPENRTGGVFGKTASGPRQAQQEQRISQLRPQLEQRNNTGLPDTLKQGVETLSGLDMSDVRVHRNSGKPAGLRASAYAQGLDIHLGPGQERHLPHEAWHVVQQKQGRVAVTTTQAGAAINDNPALEREADEMGAKASHAQASYKPVMQGTGMKRKAMQLWARWYEFDGKDYHERWIGLPSLTGWIQCEEHNGKPAWISIANVHRLPQITQISDSIEQVRQTLDEHTPLIRNVTEQVDQVSIEVEEVRKVQQHFISLSTALNNYLTNTSTILTAFALIFGLTGVITGGYLLSLIKLPMWLVASVDGISYLYGAGLLYRWMKSKLLPVWVKLPLLIANSALMIGAAGIELGQLIAYLTGLSQSLPFEHIQFAAIPFAILIEHLIVVLIEKVNFLRQQANRDRGHDEDHGN
jgi:Domain of unknown function (DUF4157)